MSSSILNMNFEYELKILTDLISYFDIENIDDDKVVLLVNFISELVSRLSHILYDELYFQFKEKVTKIEFIEWVDDRSLIIGIHDSDHWGL